MKQKHPVVSGSGIITGKIGPLVLSMIIVSQVDLHCKYKNHRKMDKATEKLAHNRITLELHLPKRVNLNLHS